MFVIGLTGSIGMGKTTTAQLFAQSNVPVHDADATVHRLYEGEAVAAIEAAFPGTAKNHKVDRTVLGQRIVGNADALKRLETIVHPLVRQAEIRFLENAANIGANVALLDIPPLFETAATRGLMQWS
jgi:dephospho-CoA kinase